MSTMRELAFGCKWPSAAIISKTFLGQHVHDEYWLIRTDSVELMFLHFDDFDIGCRFNTHLQIGKVKYCNANRPLDKLTDTIFRIEFHTMKPHGRSLVEGFSARYGVEVKNFFAAYNNSVVRGNLIIVHYIIISFD